MQNFWQLNNFGLNNNLNSYNIKHSQDNEKKSCVICLIKNFDQYYIKIKKTNYLFLN